MPFPVNAYLATTQAFAVSAKLHTNYCLYQSMIGHLRISSPWSQLAVFLGLFVLSYVVAVPVSLLIYKSNGIPVMDLAKIDWNNPQTITVMKLVQALSSILLFILPAIAFALIVFTGRYAYFLGLKPAQKPNMYVLAIAGILLALPFVFWLGDLNQKIPLPESFTAMEEEASRQMEAFLKVHQPFDIVLNVLIIGLLPAIGEELCFRGALQRVMINITKNPWIGIIVTAILFSALHMQFQGFLPRMFLGIVLGAFYWFSGSLWTSIAAHFVHNSLQVIVVSYAPQYVSENPDAPLLAAIASGVAVWAILWFYSRQSTITYSKVYQPNDLTPNNEFIV